MASILSVHLIFVRFVQYWARIGSENITSCHRPTCRKEGVLLDYSIDGGMFVKVYNNFYNNFILFIYIFKTLYNKATLLLVLLYRFV